jgi:hypothetical protein
VIGTTTAMKIGVLYEMMNKVAKTYEADNLVSKLPELQSTQLKKTYAEYPIEPKPQEKGKHAIQNIYIFSESVDDTADGSCIEEVHRSLKDSSEHLVMKSSRRVDCA